MIDTQTSTETEGNNSPLVEREKTVAELEAEARTKAQGKRKESAPVEDIKPDQPEVNRLKKRGKNRLMTLGVLFLAALVVLAWMGDWAYKNFVTPPAPKADLTKNAPEEVSSGMKRKGMGLAENPLEFQAAPEKETVNTTTLDKPQPLSFNKSIALAMSSSPQESTQNATSSREAERISLGNPDTSEPYKACAVKLVMDASGKLICPAGGEAIADDISSVSIVTGVQRMKLDPNLYIPVDTYIPCTLQTRFVSDVAGRISCLISEDVYSESTHVRLIPAGTRARGVYKTGTLNQGQARMFVMWTELRTPNGLKIPLTDSQVVGQLGEAGIDGWIDTHFWERFGNAMMLSTVQDIAAAAASSAPSTDRNTDYTENSRAAASEMAKTALDNSINIPPTIYKNQGDIIGIMTGSDIDFSSVYSLKLK